MIAVNAAAVLLPINGYTTGALSDLNPTGFTPAGYVFSIWSLIYLGLIVFGFSQILASERVRERGRSIHALVLINAAANAGWIFAWHYRQVALSLLIMLAILATLASIYVSLRRQGHPDWREFVMIDGPFSLYLGWISSATILNLAAAFFDRQSYPFNLSMDEWAVVSVTAAVALYTWLGTRTRDVVYCAVFVWASYGIFSGSQGIGEPVRMIAITGTAMTSALIIWIVATTLVRRSRTEAVSS